MIEMTGIMCTLAYTSYRKWGAFVFISIAENFTLQPLCEAASD
jgi:hypothetical protein